GAPAAPPNSGFPHRLSGAKGAPRAHGFFYAPAPCGQAGQPRLIRELPCGYALGKGESMSSVAATLTHSTPAACRARASLGGVVWIAFVAAVQPGWAESLLLL